MALGQVVTHRDKALQPRRGSRAVFWVQGCLRPRKKEPVPIQVTGELPQDTPFPCQPSAWPLDVGTGTSPGLWTRRW